MSYSTGLKSGKFLSIVLAFVGLVFTGMIVAVALHAANHAYGVVYDTSSFMDR
ncbi:MAG: hypothetical protein ACR2O5_08505 [Thiogranum sp.]